MDCSGVNADKFLRLSQLGKTPTGIRVRRTQLRQDGSAILKLLKIQGGTIRRNLPSAHDESIVGITKYEIDFESRGTRPLLLQRGIKAVAPVALENCATRESGGNCDKATIGAPTRLPIEKLDRAMNADYHVGKRATQRASHQRRRRGGRVSLVSHNYARSLRAGITHVWVN